MMRNLYFIAIQGILQTGDIFNSKQMDRVPYESTVKLHAIFLLKSKVIGKCQNWTVGYF